MYYGSITREAQCQIRRRLAVVLIVLSLGKIFVGLLAVSFCLIVFKSTQMTYNVEDANQNRLVTSRFHTVKIGYGPSNFDNGNKTYLKDFT